MSDGRTGRDAIPERFASIAEAAEFWGTRSTADRDNLRRLLSGMILTIGIHKVVFRCWS